eukprot:CAMPEP_0179425154 /NCGR_PEP_ID=MMETSP0799-20121207/12011_1 /TAXON_ID=46947 /ORGANISM="Geminigera cryophila, Strain CCMP2564" /LENGTH=562 /DNA_ID=CAMNT_0021199735 /DNA_START=230 /DNA_END=1918 /DNA_ORIENTATION=+
MAGNVGCVSTMVVFLVAVMHAQSVHADDTWEVWSTKPDGTNELQDALLIQGHLRHTVTQNDFEAFKNVLSSQGCSAGSAPAKCEVLLHHGDPNGRTIYHLIGKLGLGGDYVAASDVASNNVTGFFSVDMAIDKKILEPDTWRNAWAASASIQDTGKTSILYRIFDYSKNVLGITPKLQLRDESGQTPMHEAALQGRVLTLRAMAILTQFACFRPDPSIAYDVGFVRARPLRREWGFGWTMMNFGAISVRDTALRTGVQAAMVASMESQENFDTTLGMTIMDYAALNGHTAVVDYLARQDLDKNGLGLEGLGFAPSNWREKAVQKAITLGHDATVLSFVDLYGCARVFGAVSEGGETILHNAVGGGHAAILSLLRFHCKDRFEETQNTRTKLNQARYLWSEHRPCLMSEQIIDFINNNEFGADRTQFPEGFVGNARYRCSHNTEVPCLISSDCQALVLAGETSTCDLSLGGKHDVWDLLHHFETCHLVCSDVSQDVEQSCGPVISDALRAWLRGNIAHLRDPWAPRDPSRGPPSEWADYRADPGNWFVLRAQARVRDAANSDP